MPKLQRFIDSLTTDQAIGLRYKLCAFRLFLSKAVGKELKKGKQEQYLEQYLDNQLARDYERRQMAGERIEDLLPQQYASQWNPVSESQSVTESCLQL